MKKTDYSVYTFYENDCPVYVGQSVDFFSRYDQHRRQSLFFSFWSSCTVQRHDSKQAMCDAEKTLIQLHTPRFNTNFVDKADRQTKNKKRKKQYQAVFPQRISFFHSDTFWLGSLDYEDAQMLQFALKTAPVDYEFIKIIRNPSDFVNLNYSGELEELHKKMRYLVELRKNDPIKYFEIIKPSWRKRKGI